MKKNLANFDRVIRITVALFIVFLIFIESVSGGLGISLSIFGGLFFLTGFTGECPVYGLLRINRGNIKPVKGRY